MRNNVQTLEIRDDTFVIDGCVNLTEGDRVNGTGFCQLKTS